LLLETVKDGMVDKNLVDNSVFRLADGKIRIGAF
jgi:hypothetical protein